MNIEQIIKLIDAGFTKADIEAMNAPANVSTEPVAEPVTEPAAEPVVEKEPEPVPAAPSVNDAAVNALLDEVKSLRKQLQLHAIVNDGFTPADPDTAQQILASIINPDPIEKKGK